MKSTLRKLFMFGALLAFFAVSITARAGDTNNCRNMLSNMAKEFANAATPPDDNLHGQCTAACRHARNYMKDAKCVDKSDAQVMALFTGTACGAFTQCPPVDGEECPVTPSIEESLDGNLDPDCNAGALAAQASTSGQYVFSSLCIKGADPEDTLPVTVNMNFAGNNPGLYTAYDNSATITIFTEKVKYIEITDGGTAAIYRNNQDPDPPTYARSTLVANDGINQWITDGVVPATIQDDLVAFVNALLNTNIAASDYFLDDVFLAFGLNPATGDSLYKVLSSLVVHLVQVVAMVPQMVAVLDTGFLVKSYDDQTMVTVAYQASDLTDLLAGGLNEACVPGDKTGDACLKEGQNGVCKYSPQNIQNNQPPPNGTYCGTKCQCEL